MTPIFCFLHYFVFITLFGISVTEKYEEYFAKRVKKHEAKEIKHEPHFYEQWRGKDLTHSKIFNGVSADYQTNFFKDRGEVPKNPVLKGRTTPVRVVRQTTDLPASFDWRNHTNCPSVKTIRQQGSECGSCWAVSGAKIMSDRYCLFTGQTRYFSALHLVGCVKNGCDYGYPNHAFEYFVTTGVATGGDATVPEVPAGCIPYPLDQSKVTPACAVTCNNGGALDRLKGFSHRYIKGATVEAIKQEIYTYGPVGAIMETYNDFSTYKPGTVYSGQPEPGEDSGLHAIVIMGWTKVNGQDVWIVANSHGTDFGDQGFMYVLRGALSIEKTIYTVCPTDGKATSG